MTNVKAVMFLLCLCNVSHAVNISDSSLVIKRHPEEHLVGVSCVVSHGVVFVALRGLVVGVRYELQLVIDEQTAGNAKRRELFMLPVGETGHVVRVPLPAAKSAPLLLSATLFDDFPGLDADESFLTAFTKHFSPPFTDADADEDDDEEEEQARKASPEKEEEVARQMAQAKEIKPNPPELTNPLEKEEEARQKAEAEKLRAEAAAAEAAAAVVVTGTEFTGFTGKKSQIPTLSTPAQVRAALEIAARFTGFTYTKVQILTQILTLRTRRREQQPLQVAPRAAAVSRRAFHFGGRNTRRKRK